ncbi:MAG: hypothetical protein Q4F54_04000 [Coriobacteriia bacterium]|nr:hypothetical protein [Coriobacteriia bacterium]
MAPGYVVIQAKVLTINVNDSKYYDPEEATHEKFVHWVNVDKTSPSYEVDGLAEGEEINSIKLETVSGEKGKYDELNKEFTSVID